MMAAIRTVTQLEMELKPMKVDTWKTVDQTKLRKLHKEVIHTPHQMVSWLKFVMSLMKMDSELKATISQLHHRFPVKLLSRCNLLPELNQLRQLTISSKANTTKAGINLTNMENNFGHLHWKKKESIIVNKQF